MNEVIHQIEKDQYAFHCPGCKYDHVFIVPTWTWNGDIAKPTVSPSIRVRISDTIVLCHLFIKDGDIQFLSDCKHELAGQTIPMVIW